VKRRSPAQRDYASRASRASRAGRAGRAGRTCRTCKTCRTGMTKKAAPLYAGSFFLYKDILLLVWSHKLIQAEFVSRNRPDVPNACRRN